MNQTSKFLVLLAALSLSLCACTEKKSAAPADSKVAMKVNGQAISVAELDIKSGNTAGAKKHAISGPTLKSITDLELLRQAAVQSKLDADENIRAKIAIATRTILAMAYMEKQLAAIGKPSESEISVYFSQHPERFAERKRYDLQELLIQPPPGEEAEIQAQLGRSKKFDEFDRWLTEKQISHSSNQVSVTTDRIPEEVLQKLKNLPVGGSAILGDKEQMHVIFKLAEQLQPVTLAQASPIVANMLMYKRKSETMDNMVKSLRDKAKIEYVPPYTANGLPTPVNVQ